MKPFALGLFVATGLIGVWLYLQQAPSCVYPFYASNDCQTETALRYQTEIDQLKQDNARLNRERADLEQQYRQADEQHQAAIDTLATLLDEHVGRNEDDFRKMASNLLDFNNRFVQMRALICRHAVAEYVEGCGLHESAGVSGQP